MLHIHVLFDVLKGIAGDIAM